MWNFFFFLVVAVVFVGFVGILLFMQGFLFLPHYFLVDILKYPRKGKREVLSGCSKHNE